MGPNRIEPKVTRPKVVELAVARHTRRVGLPPVAPSLPGNRSAVLPPLPIRSFALELADYEQHSDLLTGIDTRSPRELEACFLDVTGGQSISGELFFDRLLAGLIKFSANYYQDAYHFIVPRIDEKRLSQDQLCFLYQLGELYQQDPAPDPAQLETAERIMVKSLEHPTILTPFQSGRGLIYLMDVLACLPAHTWLLDWITDPKKTQLLFVLCSWGEILEQAKKAITEENSRQLRSAIDATRQSSPEGLLAQTPDHQAVPLELSKVWRARLLLRSAIEAARQPRAKTSATQTFHPLIFPLELDKMLQAQLLKTAGGRIPFLLNTTVGAGLDTVSTGSVRHETDCFLIELIGQAAQKDPGALLEGYISCYLTSSNEKMFRLIAEIFVRRAELLPALLTFSSEANKFSTRALVWLSNLAGIRTRDAASLSLRPVIREVARTIKGEEALLLHLIKVFSGSAFYSQTLAEQLRSFQIDGRLARQIIGQISSRQVLGEEDQPVGAVRANIIYLRAEDIYSARKTIFLAIKLWQLSDLQSGDQPALAEAALLAEELSKYTSLAKQQMLKTSNVGPATSLARKS